MTEAVILHSLYFIIRSQYGLVAVIEMLDTVNYTVEFYQFFYCRLTSIGVIPELICAINIPYAYRYVVMRIDGIDNHKIGCHYRTVSLQWSFAVKALYKI